MSPEKPSFVVAVEISEPFEPHVETIAALKKTGAPCTSATDRDTWFFRALVTTRAPIVLKPGLILYGENEGVSRDDLPPLPRNFIGAIYKANQAYHNDEPEMTAEWSEPAYQPTPAECEAWGVDLDDRDAEPRASFDHAKPEIVATFSGMDYQRNEAQSTQPAPDEPRIVWIEDPFAPLPAIDWICEELQIIRGGRIMSVAAYGGTGKSLSMMDAYVSMAAGLPIWGADHFRVSRPLIVAHLDADQGQHATLLRLQRLARAKGLDFGEIRPRIRIASLVRVPLTHPKAIDVYCRALDGVDFALFDALRGFTTGIDENDSRVRDEIDKLTFIGEQTKTAICLIHHQGKPGQNENNDYRQAMRGSSAIFDACGTVFKLEGKPDEMAKTLTHIKPAAESTGGVIPKCHLVIEDVSIDGDPRAGVRVVYRSADELEKVTPAKPKKKLEALMRQMLEHVKVNGGISTRALFASLDGGTGNKQAAHDELVRLGYLQIQKGAKRNEPHKNFATGPGLAWLGGSVVHIVGQTPAAPPSAPQDAPTTTETSANPTDTPKDA